MTYNLLHIGFKGRLHRCDERRRIMGRPPLRFIDKISIRGQEDLGPW